MSWAMVPLGEVCEIISGATPKTGNDEFWDGEIAWATPKDLSVLGGRRISETSRHITDRGLSSCAARILPAGSVLLSSRAPIGLVAINDVPMATNQGFKSLVPHTNRVDANYLAHWLEAHTALLQSLGNGATFKEISKQTVSKIEVPLPSLDEQRRIAAILDHVDALRAKAREAEKLADEAVPAELSRRYLNGAGTRQVQLGDVLMGIENGRSPVCEPRPRVAEEVGVLKLGAVSYGRYDPSANKAFLGEVRALDLMVNPGDLLMSRKNTPELVGATVYVDSTPPDLYLPDLIFRLKVDAEIVEPAFLQALVMSSRVRAAVRREASGSAASMVNISKARLKTVKIVLPSLEEQRAFLAFRARMVNSIAVLSARTHRLNALYGSVQSRAFQGAL